MTIYTNAGWARASEARRTEQGRVAQVLPIKWRCRCFKCWDCKASQISVVQKYHFYVNEAGNPDYVKVPVPVCHKCGRPHQRHDGSYFDMRHTKMCSREWENASVPGIKMSDIALLTHLMGEVLKHFENKDKEKNEAGSV